MENGKLSEIELSIEQRMAQAMAETAVLLIRVGRDGSIVLSGDVITAGDDVRAYGLLEKLKYAVGPICQQRRAEQESRISQHIGPLPPGLRISD